VVEECKHAPRSARARLSRIDVRRILADVRGPVRVHLCVSATCNSTSKRDGRQLDAVFLDDPSIHDSGPVLVGLSIESGSGEVIYARKANVELSGMQPNGPSCPPMFDSTALVATARGGLQPRG
jgi:hypothetical protein